MVKENESTSTNEFFLLVELYQPSEESCGKNAENVHGFILSVIKSGLDGEGNQGGGQRNPGGILQLQKKTDFFAFYGSHRLIMLFSVTMFWALFYRQSFFFLLAALEICLPVFSYFLTKYCIRQSLRCKGLRVALPLAAHGGRRESAPINPVSG